MKYSLFLFYLLALSGCNKKNCNYILERTIDVSVITTLSTKAELPRQQNTYNSYEVKIWRSFVNDSFPVLLNDLTIDNEKLEIKNFVFYKRDQTKISSKEDANNGVIRAFKFDLINIPLRLKDSLLINYSSKSFPIFNASSYRKIVENQFKTGNPGMTYIEINDNSGCHKAFISSPKFLILNNLFYYQKYLGLINLVDSIYEYADKNQYNEYIKILESLN